MHKKSQIGTGYRDCIFAIILGYRDCINTIKGYRDCINTIKGYRYFLCLGFRCKKEHAEELEQIQNNFFWYSDIK